MSAQSFHRNHAQHISIAEKLSEELRKTEQDILSEINNLNQKLSDQLLIKVINEIVRRICGVIPDLQEVIIKSSSENENNAGLMVMLNKLSQYCNEMVQGYDSDFSTLKIKFQTFIKNILLDAESLLNIIKKDNLHDFKYELVESLKDIVYSIQLGKIRIQIESCTEQEVKILVANAQKGFYENISIIEKCSLKVLNTININLKYNAKQLLKTIYYFNKVASNYEDIDIQRKILDATSLLNAVVVPALLMDGKVTDIKEAVNVLKQLCEEGWKALNKLYELNEVCFKNKKSFENFRDVVMFKISNWLLITIHLGSFINHDAMFALLE